MFSFSGWDKRGTCIVQFCAHLFQKSPQISYSTSIDWKSYLRNRVSHYECAQVLRSLRETFLREASALGSCTGLDQVTLGIPSNFIVRCTLMSTMVSMLHYGRSRQGCFTLSHYSIAPISIGSSILTDDTSLEFPTGVPSSLHCRCQG